MSLSPTRPTPNSSPQHESLPRLSHPNLPNSKSINAVVLEILKCPISGNIMESPHLIIPCGHHADHNALREWYKQRREKICPVCKQTYEKTNLIAGLKDSLTKLKSLGIDLDSNEIKFTAEAKHLLDEIEVLYMNLAEPLQSQISKAVELFKKGQRDTAMDQICELNFDLNDSRCETILNKLLSIQNPQKGEKKRPRESTSHSPHADEPISKMPRQSLEQIAPSSSETRPPTITSQSNALQFNPYSGHHLPPSSSHTNAQPHSAFIHSYGSSSRPSHENVFPPHQQVQQQFGSGAFQPSHPSLMPMAPGQLPHYYHPPMQMGPGQMPQYNHPPMQMGPPQMQQNSPLIQTGHGPSNPQHPLNSRRPALKTLPKPVPNGMNNSSNSSNSHQVQADSGEIESSEEEEAEGFVDEGSVNDSASEEVNTTIKKKRGKKTPLTPEVIKTVEEKLKAGMSVYKISKDMNIPNQTLYEAVKKGKIKKP